MSRGDHGEAIFNDDADRRMLLETLSEMCERTGIMVHSYVLMFNHYHLLIETPEPNLVAGMKWFQSTYTLRYNSRHQLHGHLFQGRYKAVPVKTEEPEYFRAASTYIHLNPVRARLLSPENLDLKNYAWSSYPVFIGERDLPKWLYRSKLFAYENLPDEGWRSRRRYAELMKRRVKETLQVPDQEEVWQRLRRGWYLGDEDFRDRLMEQADKLLTGRQRASFSKTGMQFHDEKAAEKLLKNILVRLQITLEKVQRLRQNDPQKQAVAWCLRRKTIVDDAWICRRLEMGSRSNVSRAVMAFRSPVDSIRRRLKEVLHKCAD
jgi:REP element-mobilizing transposase RayT